MDHVKPLLESEIDRSPQTKTVPLTNATAPSSVTSAPTTVIQGWKQGGRLPKGEAGFPWGQEKIKATDGTTS